MIKYLVWKQYICDYRKADQIFSDNELWKSVPDRDRRELYEDIMHQLEKREKVNKNSISSIKLRLLLIVTIKLLSFTFIIRCRHGK